MRGGLPLPGVSVMIKGTTQGTVTDVDGNFSIPNVGQESTLVFSFVGLKTQEILVGNRTTFEVVMEEQSIGLEEVVAVGYGVQKKESVVGSIAQASEEELKRTGNVTDLRQALSGNLPGIVFTYFIRRTGRYING